MSNTITKTIATRTLMILIMLSIIISSSHYVSAAGMAPSKKIIAYDNQEQAISGRIINNEGRDMVFEMTKSGELAQYITIDTPIITIKASEPEKTFTYRITLPQGLYPGTKSAYITATEKADETGTDIGGAISLSQQLQVSVPYNGKYVEAELSMTEDYKTLTAAANIMSVGTQDVDSITVEMSVQDINDVNVYERTTQKSSLAAGSSVKHEERININKPGEYILGCKVTYDGKEIYLEKPFNIGDYNIRVLGAEVKNFKLGTIARFDINISSDWNTAIEGVYSNVDIMDKDRLVVDSFQTDKMSVDPSIASPSISAYWDTKNIEVGEYNVKITVYAGNEMITKEYKTFIYTDKILVVQPGSEIPRPNYRMYVLIAVPALMMLILGVVLLLKVIRHNRNN